MYDIFLKSAFNSIEKGKITSPLTLSTLFKLLFDKKNTKYRFLPLSQIEFYFQHFQSAKKL
jgi:hypothetical protein